jgi:predicted nucleic acid-binding protein
MILVDTSVLIDYLKGNSTPKAELFDKIVNNNMDYCISALTYQELLQGSRNEKEFEQLKDFFSSQIILPLPTANNFYEQAAKTYFSLRRQGKTIRSTVDVIIAMQTIIGNHILLHDDKDFDVIAEFSSEMRVLTDLTL